MFNLPRIVTIIVVFYGLSASSKSWSWGGFPEYIKASLEKESLNIIAVDSIIVVQKTDTIIENTSLFVGHNLSYLEKEPNQILIEKFNVKVKSLFEVKQGVGSRWYDLVYINYLNQSLYTPNPKDFIQSLLVVTNDTIIMNLDFRKIIQEDTISIEGEQIVDVKWQKDGYIKYFTPELDSILLNKSLKVSVPFIEYVLTKNGLFEFFKNESKFYKKKRFDTYLFYSIFVGLSLIILGIIKKYF